MSDRPKKSCGHEVGYRCPCHPLANRTRRIPDSVEFMERRQRGDLRTPGEDVLDEEDDDV